MIEYKNFNVETFKWGGSGIEKSLFLFIEKNFPKNSTCIEFGSGYCSTMAFSTIFNLYSIDDNKEYQNKFLNVNYIHAPIKNGWYDIEILKTKMPQEYSLIFVDGPAGSGNRNGILDNLSLFNNVPFIVHDTYREEEKNLAINIANKLNKKCFFYYYDDYWALIV